MDYSKLKLEELKTIAKEKGLRNISGLKKGELAELLANVEQMINRPVVKNTAKSETAEKKNNVSEAEKKQPDNETDKTGSAAPAEEKKTGKRGRPRKNEAPAVDKETDKPLVQGTLAGRAFFQQGGQLRRMHAGILDVGALNVRSELREALLDKFIRTQVSAG